VVRVIQDLVEDEAAVQVEGCSSKANGVADVRRPIGSPLREVIVLVAERNDIVSYGRRLEGGSKCRQSGAELTQEVARWRFDAGRGRLYELPDGGGSRRARWGR